MKDLLILLCVLSSILATAISFTACIWATHRSFCQKSHARQAAGDPFFRLYEERARADNRYVCKWLIAFLWIVSIAICIFLGFFYQLR
jgi:hypothetical protein